MLASSLCLHSVQNSCPRPATGHCSEMSQGPYALYSFCSFQFDLNALWTGLCSTRPIWPKPELVLPLGPSYVMPFPSPISLSLIVQVSGHFSPQHSPWTLSSVDQLYCRSTQV